jgi:hypothetical protein
MSILRLLSCDSTLYTSFVIKEHNVVKQPRTVKKRREASESIIVPSNSKYSAALSPADSVRGSKDMSKFNNWNCLGELDGHSRLIRVHISDLID